MAFLWLLVVASPMALWRPASWSRSKLISPMAKLGINNFNFNFHAFRWAKVEVEVVATRLFPTDIVNPLPKLVKLAKLVKLIKLNRLKLLKLVRLGLCLRQLAPIR